jgi:diguanylate cyclase (GGDEF)-like protein/PAS domain S-box-containing protein
MFNKFWFQFWQKWPLVVKFTVAISFAVFTTVLSVSGLSIYREQVVVQEALEARAATLLDSLEMTIFPVLSYSHLGEYQELTDRLTEASDVLGIRYYDAVGNVLLDFGLSTLEPFESTDELVRTLYNQGTLFFASQPDRLVAGRTVSDGGETVGAITIELARAPLLAKAATIQYQGALIALIIIGVGFLLAWLLSRSINEPLHELVQATRHIGRGNLEHHIEINTQDELAELAQAFNEMTLKLQQTIARKGAILEAAPVGILSFDLQGRIVEWNPTLRRMVGLQDTDPANQSLLDLILLPVSILQSLSEAGLDEAPATFSTHNIETILSQEDGQELPVEVAIRRVPGNLPGDFIAIIHDISARKEAEKTIKLVQEALEARVMERTAELEKANQALREQMDELEETEQALRESEEQYALATLGANDGLWDWDLRTDEVYFSERWKVILGQKDSEVEGVINEWFKRIHPEDLEQVKSDLSNHMKGLTPHFENEHRMLHTNGEYLWVLTRGLAVRDEDENAYRMAGSLTDITAWKKAEKQLLHDAFHDALTGLPNRALFVDRLGQAIERNKRRREDNFAVLFLDLDRFKVINDSLGHTIGDRLLVAIARRLEVFLRTVDTVARIGGDEFVILLEDIRGPEDAKRVASRIQEELALPFFPNDHKVFTSVSIGIVLSTSEYDRPEDILRDADIAMYRAKAKGRARFEIFDTEMRAQAIARLELETDLRRAIGFQEFQVHYQPIVSLETNRIIGFEALVRWQHPDRGLIPPEEFIYVAEETGLIIPIDWWVLRTACQQLADWQEAFPSDPPLTISVNVSAKHFTNLDLVRQVENILQATGLENNSLKLEITESVFMETDETAQKAFAQLQNIGIQLQIDDFGTGYSSLGYLQRFPVDTIKIDRSFVSRMDGHTTNSEIVRTIVRLARELNMEAIAEGVETREQLDQLKDLDCDFGQGFLISKPMNSAAAEKLISKLRDPEAVK